jgi:hypothetical protein
MRCIGKRIQEPPEFEMGCGRLGSRAKPYSPWGELKSSSLAFQNFPHQTFMLIENLPRGWRQG